MLAVNHAATGAIIATALRQPALVIPAALVSHFVLDVIPHHGNDPRFVRGEKAYNQKIVLDGLASILLVLALSLRTPSDAGLMAIGAFFAILPDLFWPIALHIEHKGPLWAFFKFHKNIQTSETPAGIGVEAVWAVLCGGVLTFILN